MATTLLFCVADTRLSSGTAASFFALCPEHGRALQASLAKDEMEETEQVSQGRQPSNPCHDLLEPGGWAKVYLDHVRWRVELATFLEWQA